jgi:hypothetical protein
MQLNNFKVRKAMSSHWTQLDAFIVCVSILDQWIFVALGLAVEGGKFLVFFWENHHQQHLPTLQKKPLKLMNLN